MTTYATLIFDFEKEQEAWVKWKDASCQFYMAPSLVVCLQLSLSRVAKRLSLQKR